MKHSYMKLATKLYKNILPFLVPAFLIFLVWHKMGFYYSTNDDRCITEMLAGLVTSHPDAHLVYVNYLLALPLSLLYKITTSIPWFGLCLILLYYVSYVFIFKALYSRTKNIVQDIVMTIVISCFFLSHIYMLSQITYTAIAAFVATAGYCVILLHSNKKTGLIYFIILETLAFWLRDQAMLMIQPLGIAILGMYILITDFSALKKNIMKCLHLVGIVAIIIIASIFGNKLGYLGDSWNNYMNFNESRTTLCDYTDFPPYEDVKPILDKYDVSKATYEGFSSYTILDWDINLKCLDELAEYAKDHYESPITFSDAFEKYTDILTDKEKNYFSINNLLILTCIIAFLYAVISGNIKTLLPLLGLFFAQSAVWMYLLLRGRYPARVTIPLIASETLFLIIIVFLTYTKEKHHKYLSYIRIAVLLFACIIFGKMSYDSYQLQHKYTKNINENQEIFINGLNDITEYCNNFPNNKYIVETLSLRWYCGSALQSDIFESRNYTFAGGWFSNTPCFLEKNIEYFDNTDNGFYFIICPEDTDDTLNHPAVIYLAEKSSCIPQITDSFTASHGGTYQVIHFDGKLNFNMTP